MAAEKAAAANQQLLDSSGKIVAPGAQSQAPAQADASLMDILNELRAMRAEMKEDISNVKKDVDTHTAELKSVGERQTNLETENVILRQKIAHLEDQSRVNNLIVGGVPETPGPETWETTEKKVRESLVTTLQMDQGTVDQLSIDRAQRLGRRVGNNTRVIKVSFSTNKDKMAVLRKARTVKPEAPYFREDFSPSVLDARSKLKPGLLAARGRNQQAFLAHDKLIVQNGENKNVYKYDLDRKEVRAVSHTYEDNIQWPTATPEPQADANHR